MVPMRGRETMEALSSHEARGVVEVLAPIPAYGLF
jgi:hypothetical protein